MPGAEFTEKDDWAYQRVRLMQLFRWTPETVDALTAGTVRDIWAVIAAQQMHNKDVKWFM